jgi:hypothetical protein
MENEKHKYNNLTTVDDIYYMANEMKLNNFKCFFTYPELYNYLNKYKPNNINIVYNIINKPDKVGHWISIKIINNIVYVDTNFGVLYRPLLEMFYRLNYWEIYWLLESKQSLNENTCGYYSLRFLKCFKPKYLNDLNYVYYHKINPKKVITTYHFLKDWDVKKYIKYQTILLDINE